MNNRRELPRAGLYCSNFHNACELINEYSTFYIEGIAKAEVLLPGRGANVGCVIDLLDHPISFRLSILGFFPFVSPAFSSETPGGNRECQGHQQCQCMPPGADDAVGGDATFISTENLCPGAGAVPPDA